MKSNRLSPNPTHTTPTSVRKEPIRPINNTYLIHLDKGYEQILITEVTSLEEARLLGWSILAIVDAIQVIVQDPSGKDIDWLRSCSSKKE